MEQKPKTADKKRAEELKAIIEKANKNNEEDLTALAEAEKTVPSVKEAQPKQKSTLEKMRERQARLIKEQEELRTTIEEANKDNEEALAALAEAGEAVPSVKEAQPKQKSTLEKMRERQARLIKAQAEQERLERFQKIDENITELKEKIDENGERIIIATTKAKNYYRLSSNGIYEFCNETGRRLAKGTLKKEVMKTLNIIPEPEKAESIDISAQIPVEEEQLRRGSASPEEESTFTETVKSTPQEEVPTEAKPEVLMVPREEVPIISRETVPISELEKMEDEFLRKTGESVDVYLKEYVLRSDIQGLEERIKYTEENRYILDPNSVHTKQTDNFIKTCKEALAILKEREHVKKLQETAEAPNTQAETKKTQPLNETVVAGAPEEETAEPATETLIAEVAPGPNAEADEKAATIAKLRETIATAQETLEENEIQRKVLIEELAELRRKKPPETATPSENQNPEELISDLDELESRLALLRLELEKTSKIRPFKRKNLKEQIAVLEHLLEHRKQNPFTHHLIDKLDPTNFQVLFDTNPEKCNSRTLKRINHTMPQDGKDLNFWNWEDIKDSTNNAINFSSNGFYLRLKNKKEAPRDKNGVIQLADPKSKFELYRPDGSLEADDLDFETGNDLLNKKAKEYQTQQLDQFDFEMGIREMESLKTVNEKREFLERKRKERINNIKEVTYDTEYHTENLTSKYNLQSEAAKEYLEAFNTSKLLEYYTKKLTYYETYPEDSYSKKRIKTIINQILEINTKYNRLLAGLEK